MNLYNDSPNPAMVDKIYDFYALFEHNEKIVKNVNPSYELVKEFNAVDDFTKITGITKEANLKIIAI